jgi:hypothetical protein
MVFPVSGENRGAKEHDKEDKVGEISEQNLGARFSGPEMIFVEQDEESAEEKDL